MAGKLPLTSSMSLDRDTRIWELRLKAYTTREIGAIVGVSHCTIIRILKRIEGRALARLSDEVGRLKARQTLQLEGVVSEALRAWTASKNPTQKLKISTCDGVSETEATQTSNSGTPAHLSNVLSAMKSIREIWNIGVPESTTLTYADASWTDVVEAPLSRDRIAFDIERLTAQLEAMTPPPPSIEV